MFNRVLLASIALCFCFSTASYPGGKDKEDEVFFVARKAFEDGYYEVSLGLLNRFLADFPHSAKAGEAELLIGQSYFYQNKLTEALNKFERLLGRQSSAGLRDAIFYWIAEAYFKSNNFSKAAVFYQRVIEGFPNSSYASLSFYSLGWSLFEQGDFKEALAYFKAMEDKYPGEPQALEAAFKIVECLYKLKDYAGLRDKARQLFKAFSKDKARLAYLYFYCAESEYYLDNFSQSLDFFKKALKETGDYKIQSLSRIGAGWSYLKLKDYKKAEAEFAYVKEAGLDDKSLEALLLGKGESLLRQSRQEEAAVEFEKAARDCADNNTKEAALVAAADIYLDTQDYPQAIRIYKSVLAAYPRASNTDYIRDRINAAYYQSGLGYFNKQDYEPCIRKLEECRRAGQAKGLLADAAYLLGSCYYNLGNYKKALGLFREAASQAQDAQLLQSAEYAVADSLYNLGDEKGALASFNSLRSKYPGSSLAPKVLMWLGGYYYQHNELDLAMRYFLSLAQDFSDSPLAPQAYYLMGLISSAKSQFKEAIADFRRAIGSADPGLKGPYVFALAEALESDGQLDAAIGEYNKACAYQEFREKALLRIARIYEDRDDLKKALDFYRQAQEACGRQESYAKERAIWIESIIKE